MIKPEVLAPDQEHTVVAEIFDTPLVVIGKTWFPLAEIVTWGIMAQEAGRLHPERSWATRLGVAALTMPVILGSEWCHNLAHAAIARLIGHPADAIRITWGMPLLVYHDIEDPDVTPRQHIIRALGGPLINLFFLGITALLRPRTRPKSVARDMADAALWMNVFLVSGGLLPIPYVDGGAALKWVLVDQGQTHADADETLKKVNTVTGVALGVATVAAIKKRKRFLGSIFGMFAVSALLIGLGLFKEKE